jgi:hypothetical protein
LCKLFHFDRRPFDRMSIQKLTNLKYTIHSAIYHHTLPNELAVLPNLERLRFSIEYKVPTLSRISVNWI